VTGLLLETSAGDRIRRLVAGFDERHAHLANENLADRLARCPNLMIFGAGQNGRMVLRGLREAGLTPAAFIDETPAKIGRTVDGTPVIGLEQTRDRPGAIVVVSIFSPACGYLAIATRLQARGLQTVPLFPFLRTFAAASLPFYFIDSPSSVLAAEADIAWLAERLIDRASQDLLCAQIELRLTLRYDVLPAWTLRRELPPETWRSFALIDAGAFDGDTLLPAMAEVGARVSQALALEPDPVTFADLRRNIAAAGAAVACKTLALQVAVDAVSGRRAFCGLGHQGSSFSEAGEPVETASIDDLVAAHIAPGERLCIKFDVEGAEAAALQGASRTIIERRPFLAVSAYHRPHDLWTLPRLISSFDEGYRFRLGSHGADGADLMLYAVPPG
jgi:FkbM family methyltransferase